MDRMTPQEMIDVIQAIIDRKRIQYKAYPWVNKIDKWDGFVGDHTDLDFDSFAYRVKPEPWSGFVLYSDFKKAPVGVANSTDMINVAAHTRIIKVREVLEDE